jgi:hypothetical protein
MQPRNHESTKKNTKKSVSNYERLAQDGPFASPLIPSVSKEERLAQDRPGRTTSHPGGSSFDKLRTSDVTQTNGSFFGAHHTI